MYNGAMAACGVGLGLKAQGSALVVTDIIEGGPVAKAGKVRKGDALVRVGKFRSGNVEDARQLLLGPPGSWVQLTFSRSQELMFGLDVGFQEPYTVEVMRSVPSNSFVEETSSANAFYANSLTGQRYPERRNDEISPPDMWRPALT